MAFLKLQRTLNSEGEKKIVLSKMEIFPPLSEPNN